MGTRPAKPMTLTSHNAGTLEYELTDRLRRTAGKRETAVALVDVARVHVSKLGGMGLVEVTARDGRKLLVLSDRAPSPESREEFRAFVEELHRRLLATGKPIEFVAGLKIVPAILVGTAVGILVLALLNPLAWAAIRIEIMLGLAVAGVFGGVVLTARGRKRLYDPAAIPPRLLP